MSKETTHLTESQTINFLLAEYTTLRELRQNLDSLGESRVNFFLATVSGVIVGLALINQMPGEKEIIYFINGAAFIGLFWLGLITFTRMVERSINLVLYMRGMNRIRRYFVDRNLSIEKYLWLPKYDDKPSLGYGMYNPKLKRWSLTGLPPMMALINSILATVGAVMLARVVFNILSGWTLLIGVASFLIVLSSQYRYYANRVKRKRDETEIHFPTPTKDH